MWVNICDEPVPTYGMDGKKFMLRLEFQNYYGHNVSENIKEVFGIWSSICECFFETEIHREIDDRDIIQWWKDI